MALHDDTRANPKTRQLRSALACKPGGWPDNIDLSTPEWFPLVPPWDANELEKIASWLPGVLAEVAAQLDDDSVTPLTADQILPLAQAVSALWHHQGNNPRTPVARPEMPQGFQELISGKESVSPAASRQAFRWANEKMSLLVGRYVKSHSDSNRKQTFQEVPYDDHIAERYEIDRPRRSQFQNALAEVGKRQTDGRAILELGAGTGVITRSLAPRARSWVALEISQPMAKKLSQNSSAVQAVQVISADAMRIPLRDSCVDTVIEHEALCFADEPIKAVAEAIRVLKENGCIVRLVSRTEKTALDIQLETVFHKALRRNGYGPFCLRGRGTDARITEWLSRNGWVTHEELVATWKELRSRDWILKPLENRGWPYLLSVPLEVTQECAREAREFLSDGCSELKDESEVSVSLKMLTSRTEEA